MVLVGRSLLLIVAQAITAGLFLVLGRPSPWNSAAPWWSVYGNIADLGCLALLAYFTRRERSSIRSVVGPFDRRLDVPLAFVCLAAALVCFSAVAKPVSLLAFGVPMPYMYPGLLSARALPRWAIFYSFSLWLLIWSPTEEMTYQGYCLPRILALSRSPWIAVPLVSFWLALQHSFIPFILDWRYVLWRFLAFWPAMAALNLLYLRIRRLPPFILAHWTLDIFALILTLQL